MVEKPSKKEIEYFLYDSKVVAQWWHGNKLYSITGPSGPNYPWSVCHVEHNGGGASPFKTREAAVAFAVERCCFQGEIPEQLTLDI